MEEEVDVAGDATGLEGRHVSHYFLLRRGKERHVSRYPKLSALCDCRTHIFIAAEVSKGPNRDVSEAPAMLFEGVRRVLIRRVLLDAGYDSEELHMLIRDGLKSESIIPATIGPKSSYPPAGKYRRMMRECFPKDVYGQRWQIESAFSRHKRVLGSALRATSWSAQVNEIHARILTHNLLILLFLVLLLLLILLFYRALRLVIWRGVSRRTRSLPSLGYHVWGPSHLPTKPPLFI